MNVMLSPLWRKRNQCVMNHWQSISISGKLTPENRRGEVGMCASRAHIPGEGVTAHRVNLIPSPGSRKRDPTSPSRSRIYPTSAS